MNQAITRHLIAFMFALLTFSLVGCSSPQKSAKGSSASNDSLTASAKKVEQDFSQTESDFAKLQTVVESKK